MPVRVVIQRTERATDVKHVSPVKWNGCGAAAHAGAVTSTCAQGGANSGLRLGNECGFARRMGVGHSRHREKASFSGSKSC